MSININKESTTETPKVVVSNTENKASNGNIFLFGKENYVIMLIGLGVMILGFLLMSGGKSADPNVFNADEIYSFRRITLAPFMVILGLCIEGYAIMKKPTSN